MSDRCASHGASVCETADWELSVGPDRCALTSDDLELDARFLISADTAYVHLVLSAVYTDARHALSPLSPLRSPSVIRPSLEAVSRSRISGVASSLYGLAWRIKIKRNTVAVL